MSGTAYVNGEVSFWMRAQHDRPVRPPLAGTVDADVAIVGAGLSGLWAAYHLTEADPSLKVVVLDAHHVGYGASGRNGGWLSQLIAGNRSLYSKGPGGLQGVADLQQAMVDGIAEVVDIARRNGFDIDASRGGNLVVATTQAGLSRLEARRDADLHYGLPSTSVTRLDPAGVAGHIAIDGATGGLHYPDVTRIDPSKLVLGLAVLLEHRGVVIHERSRVDGILPGRVEVGAASVVAPRIFIATEGYSGPLLGGRRIIPVNSSMIATQVLTDAEWDRINWAANECLSDAAHTFIYAQRTADGRIAIGGRGNPYRFRSGTGADGRTADATVDLLLTRLRTYFPSVEFRCEHAWSGVLGVTRDWCTSVQFDRATGIGHTVGYAGHGVTTAYLASRSLADIAFERPTDAAEWPWVGYSSKSWEPEPIRWVGVHSMYRLFRVADSWEERRGSQRTSLIARFASHLAGLAH
jgi:glycine/D-amino acid oxidase-like deaminating enzyme